MNSQKRVLAIHDISCFGKCSLTVAMPIISAAGVEVSVIPTAVLSTHTGGFEGFTYRDLTEDIMPIINHWETLNIKFDSIYTGFLGSFEQIDIMSNIFDKLKTSDNIILVDPVMADNGKLYTIFPEDFPVAMKKLCSKADVICPNITEALFLLGEDFVEGPYSEDFIEELLKKLATLGAKKIVLTGVYFDDKKLGAASYDCESGKVDYILSDKIDGYYHGTGDVFGSALLSGLLNGFSLSDSTRIAVDFTVGSILRTKEAGTDIRFGVNFEGGLPKLMKDLGL